MNGTAASPAARDGREPHRRQLVGRAEMRPAAARQPLGGGFQHQALRHRHRAQARDLVRRHHAGIEVRQEAGLAQHQRGHRGEIGDRAVVAEPRQLLARRAVAQLGLVAEREQRLLAAGRGARARDRQHLVGREIGARVAARRLREGAVVAGVAAELGERDEHLARIGDARAVAWSRSAAAAVHQRGEIIAVRERHRLVGAERVAGGGAVEQCADARSCGRLPRFVPACRRARPLHRAARARGCATASPGTRARSSGVSISSAMRGRRTTRGSMPRAFAAARCGKKLSSPKRSGTASAGEHSTAFEPMLVVRRHDREGGRGADARASRCRISSGSTSGMSPGTRQQAEAARRQRARRRRDRAGVSVARAVAR